MIETSVFCTQFNEADYFSGVTVGVPAGLWGKKKQFSRNEASYSRKLASARVHVERIIG